MKKIILSVLVLISLSSCYSLFTPYRDEKPKQTIRIIETSDSIAFNNVRTDIPALRYVAKRSKMSDIYEYYWGHNFYHNFNGTQDLCENKFWLNDFNIYRSDFSAFGNNEPYTARFQIYPIVKDLELYFTERLKESDSYCKVWTEWVIWDTYSETVVYRKEFTAQYYVLAEKKQFDKSAFSEACDEAFMKAFKKFYYDTEMYKAINVVLPDKKK